MTTKNGATSSSSSSSFADKSRSSFAQRNSDELRRWRIPCQQQEEEKEDSRTLGSISLITFLDWSRLPAAPAVVLDGETNGATERGDGDFVSESPRARRHLCSSTAADTAAPCSGGGHDLSIPGRTD